MALAIFVLCIVLCAQQLFNTSLRSSPTDIPIDSDGLSQDATSGFLGQVLVGLNEAGSSTDVEFEEKIRKARIINEDVYGWISIEDFGIDYPVLFCADDNKKYLRMDIEGQYDIAGSIYLDTNYDNEYSPIKLIHGHNMLNGTMFSNLPQMLHWESLDDAPIITFYDDLGMKQFKIFSVMSINSLEESIIVPVNVSLGELSELKEEYISRSWVACNDVPDSLEMLMLNTCWYGESGHEHNLHCVVAASRIG